MFFLKFKLLVFVRWNDLAIKTHPKGQIQYRQIKTFGTV